MARIEGFLIRVILLSMVYELPDLRSLFVWQFVLNDAV